MNGEHAQRLFDAIIRCTLDAGPGVTRPSYSEHETDAMMVVAKEALELGCLIGFDDSCNLHCVLPGSQLTEVVTGSHLDTVPHGGRYDGTAGVVAGLLALRGLKSVGHRHHTAPPDRVSGGRERVVREVLPGLTGAVLQAHGCRRAAPLEARQRNAR